MRIKQIRYNPDVYHLVQVAQFLGIPEMGIPDFLAAWKQTKGLLGVHYVIGYSHKDQPAAFVVLRKDEGRYLVATQHGESVDQYFIIQKFMKKFAPGLSVEFMSLQELPGTEVVNTQYHLKYTDQTKDGAESTSRTPMNDVGPDDDSLTDDPLLLKSVPITEPEVADVGEPQPTT